MKKLLLMAFAGSLFLPTTQAQWSHREGDPEPHPPGKLVELFTQAEWAAISDGAAPSLFDEASTYGEIVSRNAEVKTSSNPPSVEIDLGREFSVTGVRALNRAKADHTATLRLSISSDGKVWTEVWKAEKALPVWEIPVNDFVAGAEVPGRKARYLRLETNSEKPGPFHPMEVEVFGFGPPALGDSPVSATPSAREDTLAKGFLNSFAIGAAIPAAKLNKAERQLLFSNFNTVTPENCMKPAALHPAEGRFRFAKADDLVAMAQANGLTVNGHALLWHKQCPDWFFDDEGRPAGRELVLQRMRAHIASVAGHFAGKVQSWDVVNEAIDDKDEYLRKSEWFTSIGEDFVAEAFIAARKADPKAELFYNDYEIERQPKRDKALRLIRDLKQRGAPIQGIGIQGHWKLDQIPFQDIEKAILAFHAEGMNIAITELDIDVGKRKTDGADIGALERASADLFANGLPDDVQQRLADQYAQLFALFLKHRDKIARVTFWGLHDGRSWLNNWPFQRTNHPLFWDRELQAKPALSTVLALTREEGDRKIAQEPRGTASPL